VLFSETNVVTQQNAFRLKNNHNNNENNVADINTGDRFCQKNYKPSITSISVKQPDLCIA